MKARSRRTARGFTLIELMVALLAGLIVAIGVVGLSKEATNTFHEEIRGAAAEMSLRIAVERLRADLQRVAYMSTGNIIGDNSNKGFGGKISVCSGQPSTVSGIPAAFPGLKRLAGIWLQPNAALATGTAPENDPLNGPLQPDAVDLGGNFTSSDDYVGGFGPSPGGGGCGGPSFIFSMNTAAGWRLATLPAPDTTLQAQFHPGTSATSQYIVRIADNTGHFQYAATCPGTLATYYAAGPPAVAAVNLDPSSFPNGSGLWADASCGAQSGVHGPSWGNVRINPVQIAHWDVVPVAALPPTYNLPPDPNEYVYTRQLVDANGATDASTLEVIGEYAVDLKLSFTVDDSPQVLDTGVPTAPQPGAYGYNGLTTTPLSYLPLDTPLNGSWAYNVSVGGPGGGIIGPQRIRSVRFRMATRLAYPDRSYNPPPTPLPGPGAGMYRYCMTPCLTRSPGWARVRTVVSEVAIPNQARFYY